LSPSATLTAYNTHISYYSRTNLLETTNFEIGSYNGSGGNMFSLVLPRNTGNASSAQYDQFTATNYALASGQTNSTGLWMSNRTSNVGTTHKLWRNGASIAAATTTGGSMLTNNIWIGAISNGGGPPVAYYSRKQCAFASIGDGLTDLESNLFYQIVEKYQYALGRNINATRSFYFNRNYSNETNAFIFNGGITDATKISAVNTLVTTLKTAGVWTKMKAVYPMVGGTALAHKFNLVNPVDADVAYRLTFAGGWTHSSTGALPNGTNAYANTFLIPSTTFNSTTFNHLSYYSRTNSSPVSGDYVIGALEAFKNNSLVIRDSTNNCIIYADYSSGNNYRNAFITNQTNGQGLFIGSQTGSNIKLFKNSNLIASNTTVRLTNGNLPTVNMYLGSTNYPNPTASAFTDKQCAFASIGDGLTDAEATTFYNAVQAFQTTLNRQV
jgi:hypothetical protein